VAFRFIGQFQKFQDGDHRCKHAEEEVSKRLHNLQVRSLTPPWNRNTLEGWRNVQLKKLLTFNVASESDESSVTSKSHHAYDVRRPEESVMDMKWK